MYWETLPAWIWAIYYLFIFATIVVAVRSILKNQRRRFSFIVILLAISVPLLSFINNIGRPEEMTELDFLLSQLQGGFFWASFATVGYLFIIVYWLALPFGRKRII